MKKIIFVLASSILLLSAGCNITQEYTFNKDFSGTSNLEIDLSALISFMGSLDSLKDNNSLDSLTQSFDKIAEEYDSIGATNIKYGWKNNETLLFFSYDFKDIELLNNVLSAQSDELLGSKFLTTDGKIKFTKKGKTRIIYDTPEVTNDTLFNNQELASMKDYYNYTLKFNFATPIKKLNSKNAELNSDKKGFQFSGSLFDVFAPDYSMDFQVKLKK